MIKIERFTSRKSVALLGAMMALGAGIAGMGTARADTTTVTVDGTDYPVCVMEDCSDVANQTGVWFNDGNAWLIVGDATYPIVPLRAI